MESAMAKDIKTKKSFGTATIDHFIPAKQDEWPTAEPGAGDQVVGVQALACCFQPEGWTQQVWSSQQLQPRML